MDEDLKAYIIIALGVSLAILAFILPIVFCVAHNKDKNIELEKYRIEMQVKHGDFTINQEE